MANLSEPLDLPTKYQTYNKTQGGKERQRAYKHRTGRYTSSNKYLSKPFLAVDGTVEQSDAGNVYTRLQLSDGLSLSSPKGLSTLAIFAFLIRNLPQSKDGIPVIYGGGEDFNFWIKDLPRESLLALYNRSFRDRPVDFGAYQIRWQRGKAFQLKAGEKMITVNDISSWFQCDFPEAVNTWLGTEYEGTSKDIPITERLTLTRDLATVLRERLDKTNLRPRRWTGPGNSVATIFRRYAVKDAMAEVPEPVAEASRYAYAGGRIEVCHFGSMKQEASYQYDLNSAYADGLCQVPTLAGGTWHHHTGPTALFSFALYKVVSEGINARRPSPVFTRGPLGAISYPVNASNWCWSPEYAALQAWQDQGYGKFRIIECWEFRPSTPVHPFAFVADLYEQRRRLKAEGDPAQLAVKTVLQAIYGKLAQQLGYLAARGQRKEELPPYHQLEWAGFVTSWTRAKMFMAALENLDAVIAFETDALFTSKPLAGIELGHGLGQWKQTEYSELTYVQSGTYAGKLADGTKTLKVRGFLPGDVTAETLNLALTKPHGERTVTARETQFIGLGIAAQIPEMFSWRQWVTRDKVLRCEPVGKRIHEICDCDTAPEDGLRLDFWHQTICPIRDQISRQYPVEWINPDPEMVRLEQLRREINEWD